MRAGVGILEIANYGKYEIAGPGAEAWLDRLLAGRLPRAGPDRALADAEPERAG